MNTTHCALTFQPQKADAAERSQKIQSEIEKDAKSTVSKLQKCHTPKQERAL